MRGNEGCENGLSRRTADTVLLWLPTDAASTPCALGLRVVADDELAANELGNKVDNRAFDEVQGGAVDYNAGAWRCLKHTVRKTRHVGQSAGAAKTDKAT